MHRCSPLEAAACLGLAAAPVFRSRCQTQALRHLNQHGDRVFDEALERGQKLGAKRAIHHAMITGERATHHGCGHDLIALHDSAFLPAPHRQNGRMRRVDDRVEIVDAEHAEVEIAVVPP